MLRKLLLVEAIANILFNLASTFFILLLFFIYWYYMNAESN